MLNRRENDIIKNWPKNFENTQPILTIRCVTFNHENYIAECLDSILMQETNFCFQIFIHDDASTDKTAKIVKEYAEKFPKIIKAFCETENQYSKQDGSFTRIVNQHLTGKYIAMCEGDDYWTNPYKLQKQIDFLESNPDYGLCYGIAKQYHQNKKRFLPQKRGKDYVSLEYFLTHNNCIPTLTTCFKSDLFFKHHKEFAQIKNDWPMGDLPMWIFFIKNSKVKFFNIEFGVYRILQSSAAHSENIEKQIAFYKAAHDCSNYYYFKYFNKNLPPFEDHQHRARLLSTKLHNYKAAYKEYKLVPIKTKKIKILTFLHSNWFLFKFARIYYYIKYKQ